MKAKNSKKEKGVLICPRCGSTAIIPHPKDHEIPHGSVYEAFYSKRICESCGYTGYFFPEVPLSKLKAIQKEIRALRKAAKEKKIKKSKRD